MTQASGLLIVKADYRARGLHNISVELRRPSLDQLFVGQVPDAVAKTLPYLFTVCAHAQRAAAHAAVTAALDEEPRLFVSEELWTEVLHENLWRLLLDWPPALGLHADTDAFVAWRNAPQGAEFLAATRKVLHACVRPMAEKCLEMLVDRSTEEVAPDDGALSVQAPVPLAPEAWLAYWQGYSSLMPVMPVPDSIRSAFLARLAETLAAADALANGAPFPVAGAGGAGWGVGQTLTSRGVLTHAIHVVEGRVARYRVQSPTDTYFADASALSSLLGKLQFASADQARRVLNQAILALDPCVPFILECKDA
ncbi:MAG: hypothetical protein JNJ95_06600 [Dechloromonas sp.]|nr:hypothetical protein [Dechloromonas sp.]